jgi:hypothetical protein
MDAFPWSSGGISPWLVISPWLMSSARARSIRLSICSLNNWSLFIYLTPCIPLMQETLSTSFERGKMFYKRDYVPL